MSRTTVHSFFMPLVGPEQITIARTKALAWAQKNIGAVPNDITINWAATQGKPNIILTFEMSEH